MTSLSRTVVSHTLSEADSRVVVSAAGVAVSPFVVATDSAAAAAALDQLSYPVVAKLCGDTIAHKSERGLVKLGLWSQEEALVAVHGLLAAATPEDGDVSVLLSTMVDGKRELIAGLATDAQFGMTIMLGVGGVLAEAIADVVFRLVPIARVDAHDMIDELAAQKLLDPFRGEPAVDREAVADVLVALSDLATSDASVLAVDLNPLIIVEGKPIAVDALVERSGARA